MAELSTGNFKVTSGEVQSDTVNEATAGAGVTVDGVLIKDGNVDGRDLSTDGSKLDGIEASADVTDETNVKSALDGATISEVTVASGDKILLQDITDSDNLRYDTAQDVANLATPEGTAIKSTGETGGTKFLREDGDGTCSWQTPAGAGDVSGPGSSSDNTLPRWDGASGDTLQGSGITVDDSDNISGVGTITGGGTDAQLESTAGDVIAKAGSNDGSTGFVVKDSDGTEQAEIDTDGSLFLKEKAEAGTDRAGFGQVWVDTQTPNKVYFTDDAGTDFDLQAPEGTAIKSTGEAGGSKFLREDGDGTCSWQTPAGGGDVSASGTPVDEEFAIWTDSTTIEGKDNATVKTQLGLDYNIIYIDAGAMVSCTTNGAETGTNEYGTNDIEWDYFAFDGGATEERVQFKIVMPEDWDRSTVKAKFYWSSATGSSIGDTVEWAIKGGALSDSDAIDAALGTAQVISDAVLAANGGDLQISGATPALTIGGSPSLGDLITFEIYRNTDGTDDMTEDAWLFGTAIQYKKTNTVSAW